MAKTLLFEELSFNAHPCLQTQYYDGWVLRFAHGYTNRANSVSTLYPSTLDLNDKIDECERRYSSQGQSTVFKMVEGNEVLDGLLERRGYIASACTQVMTLDVTSTRGLAGGCEIVPINEWIPTYLRLNDCTDERKAATLSAIMTSVQNPVLCGQIVVNGQAIACGEVVVERGYGCLQNIVVHELHRGKGYGRQICEALISQARTQSVHTVFLQAESPNEVAVNLYTSLGFTTQYSYWYRTGRVLSN